MTRRLEADEVSARKRERLVVIAHNRLPWVIARRLVRLVDFGDGTFALGWRWSKSSWLVS